ncbi:MAG: thiamine phosphate synthase [Legionellales bacterium]|nr:thiamine phosphate synthase [Legionellales bacterium]
MQQPIGFYPIVPDATWVETLMSTGISTLQLRMKDCDEATLRDHIARAVTLCRQANIQLFINDHWQLAIEYGAFGVHVGQDDLFTADLTAIAQAGLRLGISTHSYFELARAQALHPSYLALGPIFTTTSKVMPFQPQGIATLHTWRQLTNTPLVAIGGISFDNVTQVMATEVDGVAAISLVTQAKDPVQVTQQLQAMWHFS